MSGATRVHGGHEAHGVSERAALVLRFLSGVARITSRESVAEVLGLADAALAPSLALQPKDHAELASVLHRVAHLNLALYDTWHLAHGLVPRERLVDGVALDLSRFVRRVTIARAEGYAHVTGLVTAGDVERELVEAGLPVDRLMVPRALADGRALIETLVVEGEAAMCAGGPPVTGCVAAVDAVLVDGSHVHTRPAPPHGFGPAVERLLLGSGDTLGVLTGATIRLVKRSATQRTRVARFDGVARAVTALASLAQMGIAFDELRLDGEVGGEARLTAMFSGSVNRVDLMTQEVLARFAAARARMVPDAMLAETLADDEAAREALRRARVVPLVQVALFWPTLIEVASRLIAMSLAGARLDVTRVTPEGARLTLYAPTRDVDVGEVATRLELSGDARHGMSALVTCAAARREEDAAAMLYGGMAPLLKRLAMQLDPAHVLNAGVVGFDARAGETTAPTGRSE